MRAPTDAPTGRPHRMAPKWGQRTYSFQAKMFSDPIFRNGDPIFNPIFKTVRALLLYRPVS